MLWEGTGNSAYSSLQTESHRRYARSLESGLAFTYSHALDDTSDLFALAQASLRRSERASASFDARLRLAAYFIYDVPLFSKSRWLGGWQLSGSYSAETGQPFTVNSSIDVNRDGNLTDRLNTTRGLVEGAPNGDKRTRISVLPGTDLLSLLAPPGQEGSVGRNTFRAQGINNLDLALTKSLNNSEKWRLQFRTECFNVFNRVDFATPARILEFPAFGKSVDTTLPPRSFQFALRLTF
jgi:hypothetical protein